MIESESQIRVRYVETDAGGSVHHASFIPWLEMARVEMMDHLGLPYRELEEKLGVHMAVIEVHMKILKPTYFDDKLTVKVCVKECPKAKLTVKYEILRDGMIVATAETIHTFVNREKKAVRPPEAFSRLFKSYF